MKTRRRIVTVALFDHFPDCVAELPQISWRGATPVDAIDVFSGGAHGDEKFLELGLQAPLRGLIWSRMRT